MKTQLDPTAWPKAGDIASEAYNFFVRDTRDDGSSFVKLADDAPSWLRDAVRKAHDDGWPSDEIYEEIHSAFGHFSNYDCDEMADMENAMDDIEGDIYNSDLFEWLGSNLSHQYYVDEATSEFGAFENIADAIRMGQYLWRREIYYAVAEALEEVREERYEEVCEWKDEYDELGIDDSVRNKRIEKLMFTYRLDSDTQQERVFKMAEKYLKPEAIEDKWQPFVDWLRSEWFVLD